MLDKNCICFKIYFKSSFIGVVELGKIDFRHQNCEIMYFIGDKDLWGMGIASRAVRLAIIFAFEKLKMKNIYAGTYYSNVSSQRVLLKNNFRIIGKIQKFFLPIKKGKKREAKIIFSLNKN